MQYDYRFRRKPASAMEGLATRTPIRFGFAVEVSFLHYQTSYVQVKSLASDNYLLYLYRGRLGEEWYSFILIQGARFSGKFTVELGISARENFPYPYAARAPFIGVDGLRERLGVMLDNNDTWWSYRSQEQLQNTLQDVLRELVSRGFYLLLDTYQPMLRKEINLGRAMYEEWLAHEKKIRKKTLGNRFKDLPREQDAFEHINSSVNYGIYDKILGPLKVRYKDLHWFSFHSYILAKLMEADHPEMMAKGISRLQIQDDEIGSLIGRMPLDSYLRLPDAGEERVKQYLFLKSLAMAEAFYTGEEF
jgi:hypothetical protein